MTPSARRNLEILLQKARRISSALRAEHRIDRLRDDAGKREEALAVIAIIERYCQRKCAPSTYPAVVVSAARFASNCFLRGEFSNPLSATRYLAYLFTEADSVRSRYQSDLELYLWRFQQRLSSRFNSEMRRVERRRVASV